MGTADRSRLQGSDPLSMLSAAGPDTSLFSRDGLAARGDRSTRHPQGFISAGRRVMRQLDAHPSIGGVASAEGDEASQVTQVAVGKRADGSSLAHQARQPVDRGRAGVGEDQHLEELADPNPDQELVERHAQRAGRHASQVEERVGNEGQS